MREKQHEWRNPKEVASAERRGNQDVCWHELRPKGAHTACPHTSVSTSHIHSNWIDVLQILLSLLHELSLIAPYLTLTLCFLQRLRLKIPLGLNLLDPSGIDFSLKQMGGLTLSLL